MRMIIKIIIKIGAVTILEIREKTDQCFKKKNIEVWEDLVNIKDLVVSLMICSFTTLGGYFLAPNDPPKPLLFGLTGAFMGFLICSIFVKPKRYLVETNSED